MMTCPHGVPLDGEHGRCRNCAADRVGWLAIAAMYGGIAGAGATLAVAVHPAAIPLAIMGLAHFSLLAHHEWTTP